jgi:hypothetical protein
LMCLPSCISSIHICTVPLSVSQVGYISSSHLGLIKCLTPIVRVSTQHDRQTFTKKLAYIHKIILPKDLQDCLSPKQSRKFISNKLKMGTLKGKMLFIAHGASTTKSAGPVKTRNTRPGTRVPRQAIATHSKLENLMNAGNIKWQMDIRFPRLRVRPCTPSLICTQTSLVRGTRPWIVIKTLPHSIHLAIAIQ